MILKNKLVVIFSKSFQELSPVDVTGRMLEEQGAKIITVEYRFQQSQEVDITRLSLNLKNPKISEFVLQQIIPRADVLIEAYRPGVMERFGLEPAKAHKVNPNLVYVRVSGYGQNSNDKAQEQRAGRDLSYLANSGILLKFQRNQKISTPTFPANVLSYYASGAMMIMTQILKSLLEKGKQVVVDCNLTGLMAYTSQPILLDAHLNHNGEPGYRPVEQTLPHESIFKLLDGTYFVFKSDAPISKRLKLANFANDDGEEIMFTQEIIQYAVCDMTITEIEKEYGPVQIINPINKAVLDPTMIRQDFTVQKNGQVVDIKCVLNSEEMKSVVENGWEKLKSIGIDNEQIVRIQQKMEKLNRRLPLAKL